MAISSSVTISGSVTGLSVGTKTYGPTTVSTTSPVEAGSAPITSVVLASGANTVSVPSTSTGGCIIQFASASTCTKTLKGVTGDTGVALCKNGSIFLQFDTSAPSSICITAGAADTGNTTTIFWV